MTQTVVATAAGGPPVGLAGLFLAFLRVSLGSIGAGPVWIRRMLVDQRRWLSDEEFAEILSLCQFLPGPNIVSIAVCVGSRMHGGIGAVTALSGYVAIPWTIGFCVGMVCLEYAYLPILRNVLTGISAAAAGLIISTGLRLLLPHRARVMAWFFAALAFAGLAFARLPLLVVMLALAPLSVVVAALEGARGR